MCWLTSERLPAGRQALNQPQRKYAGRSLATEVIYRLTIKQWTKATFWGWLLGVVLIILLSSSLDAVGIEHLQFYIGVGMGAGVGFAQWLLIRKYFPISAHWIWTSIFGMGIPFIIFDLISPDTFAYKLPLSVAMGGLTIGLLQVLILKNHFNNVLLWIGGSFIGWTLTALTVLSIDYTMTIKAVGYVTLLLALLNLIIIFSGGIVLGLITGITFNPAFGGTRVNSP